MRVILCLLIFLVPGLSCFASGIHYPVSGIPSSLLVNADAVVRLDETRFEIKSLNHAVWTEHLVITIFKETASVQAVFRLFYDENTSVKSIDGAMYDAEGRLLRQFKSDDIIDHSAVSEAELYTNSQGRISCHF